MNAEEALDFVRMSYEVPSANFWRQNRQKQVIQATMKEGTSVKSLLNYGSIFNAFGNNVKTNTEFEEGADGKTIVVWYYHMNDAELKGSRVC